MPDSEGRYTNIPKTKLRVVAVHLAGQDYRGFRGDRVVNPLGSSPGR